MINDALRSSDAESDRLARTATEAGARQMAAVHARLADVRARHVLAAVDAFIVVLEERNLHGERAVDRQLRARLHVLAAEIGIPLPRTAIRARDTARLHAVLLDWQETHLDVLMPDRLAYPGVHDCNWDAD